MNLAALRQVPARIWLRLLIPIAALAAVGAVLRYGPFAEYLTQQRLLDWLDSARANPRTPLLLIGLYPLLSVLGIPITPLVLAGGAVFGVWPGALFNFIGVFLGASATFWLARLLGYQLVSRLLGERHRRFEKTLRRNGFWALVRIRFLPIPFLIGNFGAALAGVRYPLFASSTALAFAPWMVVWSYFAAALVEVGEGNRGPVIRNLVLVALVLLTLTFVPGRLRAFSRARRYRQLSAARASARDPARR